MPGTGGLEACRTLRRDAELPHIPIMFVSTRAEPEDRVAGLRAGAEDYLGKPFDDDELLARVEVLLRIHQLIAGSHGGTTGASLAIGRDPITGTWTHGYLEERLHAEVKRATRHTEPLSLMVIDLDDIAAMTGVAADHTRVAAAEAIGRCTRAMDVVCRGGTTASFAVILPKTHFAGAVVTADRIWRELAATHVGDDDGVRASIGVACYPTRTVSDGDSLMEYATSALARARAEGPAHICLYQHQAYIFQPE
jgi:diguanylate cyclase (GGDEF)-like protein